MNFEDQKELVKSGQPQADLVSASRMEGNFVISLSLGGQLYRITHKNSFGKQRVSLNGKQVAEGGNMFHLQKHFKIPLNDDQNTIAELLLTGNNLDVIRTVTLKIGGHIILNQALKPPPWAMRAMFGIVGLSLIGFAADEYLTDPLWETMLNAAAGFIVLAVVVLMSRKFEPFESEVLRTRQ